MKAKRQVLIVGKFDRESFASHIAGTLGKLGFDAVRYHYGVHYSHSRNPLSFSYTKFKLVLQNVLWNTSIYEKKVEKSLTATVSTNKDICLTIVTHDFLKPDEVELLKHLTGSPVVMWFPDAVVNFGRHMFLNAPFDLLMFKDPFIVNRLKGDFPTKRIVYLPECCNPEIHREYAIPPEKLKKFECDLTTAGNLYANRVAFFEQLADMNLNIKIWGNPGSKWMNLTKIKGMVRNEYVMDREKGFAFGAAKIVLNNLHPAEIAGINCRAFEIPAMGGFQIINWRDCIPELFEPGKEIVTFESIDELKDKIIFYLSNETERRAIVSRSLKRVVNDHTYEKRLRRITELAGI